LARRKKFGLIEEFLEAFFEGDYSRMIVILIGVIAIMGVFLLGKEYLLNNLSKMTTHNSSASIERSHE
jgi:hypothetical protein